MPFRRVENADQPTRVRFSSSSIWLLAVSLGLLVLAIMAVVALALRTAEAERLVSHTIEVRQLARELMNTALNAETGVRGYLLSNDPSFLEPYNRALAKVPEHLGTLRRLTADNLPQQRAVDEIAVTLDGILDVYRRMIGLAEQGNKEAAVDLVRIKAGKSLMDEIRDRVERFSQVELDLLTSRQAVAERMRLVLIALTIGALLAATALAALLVRRVAHYVGLLAARSAELETETRLRKESEATLVQSQKMEAVGQLTGGIAHDFNNMLTIIIGNLDRLQRQLRQPGGGALAAQLSKPVEMAMQGARSAAQLTRRLLAFSRRQALAPSQVDLNRLVTGMSELLRRTVGEAISFETVLGGGVWNVFVDANQLENALLNLVVNARDATQAGGRITVETANVYLDDAYVARFGDVTPGQYALLCVSDTGSGIAPELLQRVFEPFFTTKPHGDGSGLGLAMVHGFVKQSGGHTRIYSEVGEGTTVKLYLPRHAKGEPVHANPMEAPSARPVPAHARSSERVLLVEDNESVREYAEAALRELGYVSIGAGDAAEALRVIESGAHVDLLFTDVVLPGGMNGRELADAVGRRRPGLPVLFTTGYTRNAIVHHGRLEAGVDLLDKPYTVEDLARKIRAALDRHLGSK